MADNFLQQPLAEIDPEIRLLIDQEQHRQNETLEMIASENFAPAAILECQGSVLTNKYAEGYPGARYYGGCQFVDEVERLAIKRARDLFAAEHANVQPHSGAQANAAAFQALINPGDTILGLSLNSGGHLTHGNSFNFSGQFYKTINYQVDRQSYLIDMDEVERLAHEHRPQLIIAGWSAYPRQLDFERFRFIADRVEARLLVDMAHFSGLVAAGLYPSPVPYADVVTSTVHKTLDGPRSGLIVAKEKWAKAVDKAVFPGQQGGPLMHVIAAKAVAFRIAKEEGFRERNRMAIAGARALSEVLQGYPGLSVLTGSSDVHFTLLDLRDHPLNGQEAETILEEVGITTNRNAIPFDPEPPRVTSGLRLGTSALATRGLKKENFEKIGHIIGQALAGTDPRGLRRQSAEIANRFPLYPNAS